MTELPVAGHRQRLRARFLAGEADTDLALLELLLTYAIPRMDVRPLAGELLSTFGGLPQVLAGAPEQLARIKGLGQAAVVLLKVAQRLSALPELSTSTVEFPAQTPHPSPSPPGGRASGSTNSLPSPPRCGRELEGGSQRLPGCKLQVSNNYLLEFDQLARVLRFLLEQGPVRKVRRQALQEALGLADRQVESLVSMGAAMGLIQRGQQTLSPIGRLIAEQDPFIEQVGSLEWCHYAGASSSRNLLWFAIFNRLLPEGQSLTEAEMGQRLRQEWAGQFSEKTLKTSLRAEVHFVVDAYLEQGFRKLELLHKTGDGRLSVRRYARVHPLVFCAMLYDFGVLTGSRLWQVGDWATTPGSPALLLKLDTASVRQQIEGLHERGWVRYETTHHLDQVRLKPGLTTLELLTAYFEQREPREKTSRYWFSLIR